ncbi:MAG: hypothetical protein HYU48_00940 [Candidatus Levybacteria bacterium]|nr:hypothetical protein [Candidatus Levybacteria bacterium]
MVRNKELEPRPEIKRFSEEARTALAKEGYVIYELTGRSLISLMIEVGEPFDYEIWEREYPQFMTKTSMICEVAINPSNVRLEGSDNKTLEQQLSLIAAFSAEISERINGVEAVMGDAADYAELIAIHYFRTKKMLFVGVDGTRFQAVTKTRISRETHIANVGHIGFFPPRPSILVTGGIGDGSHGFFAVPLIVPK